MKRTWEFQGQTIAATFNGAWGAMSWCSNWELVYDFVKAGILTSTGYGPNSYGHVDFFWHEDNPFQNFTRFGTQLG